MILPPSGTVFKFKIVLTHLYNIYLPSSIYSMNVSYNFYKLSLYNCAVYIYNLIQYDYKVHKTYSIFYISICYVLFMLAKGIRIEHLPANGKCFINKYKYQMYLQHPHTCTHCLRTSCVCSCRYVFNVHITFCFVKNIWLIGENRTIANHIIKQ